MYFNPTVYIKNSVSKLEYYSILKLRCTHRCGLSYINSRMLGREPLHNAISFIDLTMESAVFRSFTSGF